MRSADAIHAGVRWSKRVATKLLIGTAPIIERVTRNVFTAGGMTFDLSSGAVTPSTRAAVFWGIYESSERRAVARFLDRRYPVIELGASVGYVSVLIGKRVKPPALVAVEADPQLVRVLENNLRLNSVLAVRVRWGAIGGGENAEVAFTTSPNNTLGTLAVLQGLSARGPAISVPSLSLSELVKDLPPGMFSVVADIEGAELRMVRWEGALLRDRCHRLIMEVHDIDNGGEGIPRVEVAAEVCRKCGMEVLWTDGKVWVFGQREPLRTEAP